MAKGKGAKRIGAGTVGQGGLGRKAPNYSKEVHASNRLKKIEGRARKRQKNEEVRLAALDAAKASKGDGEEGGGEGGGSDSDDGGDDDEDEPSKKKVRPNAFGVPLNLDREIDETEFGAYKREMHAHDSLITKEVEKRKARLLRLTKKIKALEAALKDWDEEEEAEKADKEAEKKAKNSNDAKALQALMADRAAKGLKPKPPKNRRSDPSTWKLRGGARPASEVYDFDVRYVDPNLLRLEKERKSAARRVNVLYLAVRHNDDVRKEIEEGGGKGAAAILPSVVEHIRVAQKLTVGAERLETYLHMCVSRAWAMHLLNQSRPPGYAASFRPTKSGGGSQKKKKVVEDPVSPSYQLLLKLGKEYDARSDVSHWRSSALRILLALDRNDVASTLLKGTPAASPSGASDVWELYSRVLVEYVSAVLLGEGRYGLLRDATRKALEGNVYAAMLLGYPSVFDGAVEYADDLKDVRREEGPLLQAVEFAASEQGKEVWRGTEGATEYIKEELGRYFVEIEESGAGEGFLTALKDLAGRGGKAGGGNDDDDNDNDDDDDDDEDDEDDSDGGGSSGSEEEASDDKDDNALSSSGGRIKKSEKRMYAGMVLTGVEMILENGGFEVNEDAMPWDEESDGDEDDDDGGELEGEDEKDEGEDDEDDEVEEMKGGGDDEDEDDEDDEDEDDEDDDEAFDDHDSD